MRTVTFPIREIGKGFMYHFAKSLTERTDRGVLSQKAVERITEAKNVAFLHGEVVRVSSTGTKVRVTFQRRSTSGEETFVPDDYDHVIVALGFDALSFLAWMNDQQNLGPLRGTAVERRTKEFYGRCANARLNALHKAVCSMADLAAHSPRR